MHAGEIVGLAGIEGEGQREFIRAAAGIDRRIAGEVRVKDAEHRRRQPGRLSPRRHRLHSRRPPCRGRVPQFDAAREFQSRLSGCPFPASAWSTAPPRPIAARRSSSDLRIRAPSIGNQAVRVVRRQSAKGAVRPRDIRQTRSVLLGGRTDQGRRHRRAQRNLPAPARHRRPGPGGAGLVVGRHRARRPLRSRADFRPRPHRARIDRRRGHRRRHHRSQSHGDGFAREQGAGRRAGAALARFRRQRSFPGLGARRSHRDHSRRHAGLERLFSVAVQHQKHPVVPQHPGVPVERTACDRAGRRHRSVDRPACRALRRARLVSRARRRRDRPARSRRDRRSFCSRRSSACCRAC